MRAYGRAEGKGRCSGRVCTNSRVGAATFQEEPRGLRACFRLKLAYTHAAASNMTAARLIRRSGAPNDGSGDRRTWILYLFWGFRSCYWSYTIGAARSHAAGLACLPMGTVAGAHVSSNHMSRPVFARSFL
jgi:hypothetical protein